jgi:uncharacterized membrane-anchored protein YitT (DUF2179 family)
MNQIKTIAPIPSPIKRTALVLAGAVLMAINLNTFVHTANLFPGGFTGLALLIQRAVLKYTNFEIPFTVLYLVLNAFPVYISFRYIGKKFTLYSLLMIVVSSLLTDVIPGFNVTSDVLLCSVFGGLMNGIAIMCCLSADATSGGTDFIAIYFSERHGKDMWNAIFLGNCVILAVAGFLFGWTSALYSIIFQFASTQVLNMLYRRYQKTTLLIITDKPDELYHIIHEETNHGATRFEGTGCYRNSPKHMLYAVVSGDEVQSLSKELRKADPSAFINVLQTKELLGKFFTRPND